MRNFHTPFIIPNDFLCLYFSLNLIFMINLKLFLNSMFSQGSLSPCLYQLSAVFYYSTRLSHIPHDHFLVLLLLLYFFPFLFISPKIISFDHLIMCYDHICSSLRYLLLIETLLSNFSVF